MPLNRMVTPQMQEDLAKALEEAAVRVRQSIPAGYESDVQDDVDMIVVGPGGQTIPGMRSPLVRYFRIEWQEGASGPDVTTFDSPYRSHRPVESRSWHEDGAVL